ncbi:MAG: Na+/H+ antiporter NhaC family protein [Spirochaetaceae bacterium]|jgi:Na+/H+ antiporter NhaC|nr:Na+/H+ antiporter NhaC family protein [Spirochaetaceae bacterium]
MESVDVGIWSVLPPVIAIVLALITKEVIFALLLGILSGTIIYSAASGLGFIGVFTTTINLTISKLSDGNNAAMILFLALLGGLVVLVTRAGGSRAYGIWAAKKIKTQRSAGFVTALLGIIIFIDDYFNCLTVGTVMRPVTDRYKISREKLAYIIDATAAPVCVIAPISSWAASVISYYPTGTGITGMEAFIGAVPMNLYAILTLVMVMYLVIRKNGDFGPMAKSQKRALESGIVESTNAIKEQDELSSLESSEKGKVIDLLIPVVFLVIFSVLAMLWYGGYREIGADGVRKTLLVAFGDTSAGYALALGGLGALFVSFLLFVPRKLISFHEFFSCLNAGVKSMTGAIIILTLAWTISGVCRDLLVTGKYVAGLVEAFSLPIALIPAIMFIIAGALSFATGTSWGTFGILIPITINICDIVAPYLSIIALSSVMAGSVFGDHCSPISDTTILSSAGARCNHIDHVATQIPYASMVAVICFAGYIIAGFVAPLGLTTSILITLPTALILLILALLVVPKIHFKRTR